MIPVLVVAERNTKNVAVAIYKINPSWARVYDGFFIEMTIITPMITIKNKKRHLCCYDLTFYGDCCIII